MNEIKLFNNIEFGSIRIVMIDDEPWFIGKDVAEVLGYLKPSDAVRKKVDEEDRGISKMETPSGRQEMTLINESGLYSLIFGSKLLSAKKFKKWVTNEVLPGIRKTGKYETEVPKSNIELLELQIKAIKEVDIKVNDVNQDLQNFKQDLPILGIEESKITNAVKRKGVLCLGGKNSNAYRDRSLRSKVYSDIHNQLKREFGVTTYKAIKRKQCEEAERIINNYHMPFVIEEEVRDTNNQLVFDEAD